MHCTGGAAISGVVALPCTVCNTRLSRGRDGWVLRFTAAICTGGAFCIGGCYDQQALWISGARHGLMLACVSVAATLVIERLGLARIES